MQKLVITFITALSLAALPAYADRGNGHGGYNHHGGGGGAAWAGLAVVGALTGLAIMAERSRPVYVEPYYVERVYSEPLAYTAPPVYSVPARPVPENWYYCRSSAMYYPYTNACPEGWQAVPAR
jgi:hypothetical protein